MSRCIRPNGKAKIKHATPDEAQSHADRLNLDQTEVQYDYPCHYTTYLCDRCGFYHVGSIGRSRFDDRHLGCLCEGVDTHG